jgi:hypothetical protein
MYIYITQHMDPPAVVFIFAGYEKPMEDFLKVNEGLARRIPYRQSSRSEERGARQRRQGAECIDRVRG